MGIEVRASSIRVCFTWEGQRYRETLPLSPTQTNIAAATRLARDVGAQIKAGVFSEVEYRRLFPRSKRFTGVQHTFGELAQDWIDSLSVSENTKAEYKKALNRYWMPHLALLDVRKIRRQDIRKLVSGIEWPSAKTRNNALIPLRGVFDLAIQDDIAEINPADRIKNEKHQKPLPDPFTPDEVAAILGHLERDHLCEYFRWQFATGMRPSETLALTWADVDLRQGYARVSKARSKGRDNASTKNAKARDVRLNDEAMRALKAMKARTYLAGKEVFLSQDGEPYRTEKAHRAIFTRALRKLGIRHRPAYNCRHTYATTMLMAGAPPLFVANQLGHSPVMTLTVYSRWLSEAIDPAQPQILSQKL
jgi:integrase